MAIGIGTASLANTAIGATGINGTVSNANSSSAGLGFGLNSGKSFSQGGSSSYDLSDSFNQSWNKQYGSEATAQNEMFADTANKMTEKWMQKNMDFQEYMSNTAYQRQVQDLLKAGLNPYLAATSLGGASTPIGAMAQAAMAQAVPNIESGGYGYSHGEGRGSSWNVGGSNNYGINFEINSGQSGSKSEPALWNMVGNAIKAGANASSGKTTSSDWKGFESSAYDDTRSDKPRYDDRGFRLN